MVERMETPSPPRHAQNLLGGSCAQQLVDSIPSGYACAIFSGLERFSTISRQRKQTKERLNYLGCLCIYLRRLK